MANIFEMFGWKMPKEAEEKPNLSFAPEITDDGAMLVASGGAYGTYIDLESSAHSEAELVTRYRDMADQPEVDAAVNDVVNEAVVMDEDYIVRLITDNLDVSTGTKKKIEAEFTNILKLLDFNENGYEIFKRWYVDGRLYYHAIINDKKPEDGLIELRYVDPRKMRKVRETEIDKDPKTGITLTKTKAEYFVYSDRGFGTRVMQGPANQGMDAGTMAGLKISKDAILYCTSGLMDTNNQLTYSYLHKAIKPLNQLRVLEDAIVIYRISRAPERRIFYLDVGNLPKAKAEQYVRETMARHKNKLVYDAGSGEIRDDRKFMTMMEDYWFPRRDGKGTDVQVLPAGANLGELTDVEYFEKKLYKALGVPSSRLDPDLGVALGRATEISRDEIKFSKFINRLRRRFNHLFLKALEKQLILKKIITADDWDDISRQIKFDYIEDGHYAELKNLEIMSNRMNVVALMQPFIGVTYSWEEIRRTILKQDDEDIKRNDDQIKKERDNEQFMHPDLKMLQAQQDMGILDDGSGDTEEPDSLGAPTGDPNPGASSPEDENNIGKPAKPPFGKKNGPDTDTPEGQKSNPTPKPKGKAGRPRGKTAKS